MKIKIKGVFLTAILTTVLCLSGSLLAYSGGTGTPVNPYQIANVADFQQLSATPTHWNRSFILTANIRIDYQTFTQAPIAPDTNSSSAGFQGTQFTGVFDGNGCVIGYLTITASTKDYIGLFGYVGTGGKIRNLGVKNVNITGRDYVGGLVGYNYYGSLTDCYVTGLVSGTGWYAGGLVGYNYTALLTDCYATGSVSGTGAYIGGLVGWNFFGTLTACYATGSVSGIGVNVGGLMGWNNYGSLFDCYATGSVTGYSNIGGLAGRNYEGSITDCYATGSVSGTDVYYGGLVGFNNGSLTDCFWDTQTSGQTSGAGGTSTGVTGKSTEEMKTLATFTSAGWDFLDIWDMEQVQTYPYLQTRPSADLNNDGVVNLADFAIFAGQWLNGI